VLDDPLDRVRRSLERARSERLLGRGPIEQHVEHARGFATIIEHLAARREPLPKRVLPPESRLSRETIQDPLRIVDLGSGAGLPGLIIGALLVTAELVLVEGGSRRARLLEESVKNCDLTGRTSVAAVRAEEAGRKPAYRGMFDVVVARAFGPPAVTAENAAPFLRQGGWLVVSEPPEHSDTALRWRSDALGVLGMRLGDRWVIRGFHYQVIWQDELCTERFPRRVGVATKRPLF